MQFAIEQVSEMEHDSEQELNSGPQTVVELAAEWETEDVPPEPGSELDVVLTPKDEQEEQRPDASAGRPRRVSRSRKQDGYGKPNPFNCNVCGEKFYSDDTLAGTRTTLVWVGKEFPIWIDVQRARHDMA